MGTILQVGITGGIGAGKSLITRIFSILGIPVYDADSRARKLMTEDPVLTGQIRKAFGAHAYLPDGSVNSRYLSQQAFSGGKADALNELVHPRVAEDFEEWSRSHVNKPYVIKEAALLYEAGSYAALDKVIVVTAPEALRIQRVLLRDPQRTADEIQRIIARQWPEEEKISRADFVITNDEQKMLIPQVLWINDQLLNDQ